MSYTHYRLYNKELYLDLFIPSKVIPNTSIFLWQVFQTVLCFAKFAYFWLYMSFRLFSSQWNGADHNKGQHKRSFCLWVRLPWPLPCQSFRGSGIKIISASVQETVISGLRFDLQFLELWNTWSGYSYIAVIWPPHLFIWSPMYATMMLLIAVIAFGQIKGYSRQLYNWDRKFFAPTYVPAFIYSRVPFPLLCISLRFFQRSLNMRKKKNSKFKISGKLYPAINARWKKRQLKYWYRVFRGSVSWWNLSNSIQPGFIKIFETSNQMSGAKSPEK